MKRYEYIVKDLGEKYPDDARGLDSEWDEDCPDYVAEDAGQDNYDNHDGWEDSWPMKFEIFSEGKSLGVYWVNMEAEPRFYANEVKES
jgi:hypothetical protein